MLKNKFGIKLVTLLAETRKIWVGLGVAGVLHVLHKNGITVPVGLVTPEVNAVIVAFMVWLVPNAAQVPQIDLGAPK